MDLYIQEVGPLPKEILEAQSEEVEAERAQEEVVVDMKEIRRKQIMARNKRKEKAKKGNKEEQEKGKAEQVKKAK